MTHHLLSPATLRLPRLRLLKHLPPLPHLPGTLQAQLVQVRLQAQRPRSVTHTQLGRSDAALELVDEEQRRLRGQQKESGHACLWDEVKLADEACGCRKGGFAQP